MDLPGKPKLRWGMGDDSVAPPERAQRALAPGAKVLPQTGKTPDLIRDASRKALPPGKRISRTGKTYWESRRNRSDLPGKNL